MTDESYKQWLAKRRKKCPSPTLVDQIMNQIEDTQPHTTVSVSSNLVERIEGSRTARFAACVGALAVGCLPFVFLARAAKFLKF